MVKKVSLLFITHVRILLNGSYANVSGSSEYVHFPSNVSSFYRKLGTAVISVLPVSI